MKKTVCLTLQVCLLLLLLTTGCKKETIQDNPKPPTPQGTKNPADFIQNSQDSDDERVNQCLYDISIAARNILRNGTVSAHLITAAASTNHREVDLLAFLDAEGRLGEFSESLAVLTNNNPDLFYADDYIEEQLEYDQEYIAKVYVPNMSALDPDQDPFICAGVQIDEDIHSADIDEILWWEYANNAYSLNSISEASAKASDHPVYIITHGVELASNEQFVEGSTGSVMARKPNSAFPRWRATSVDIDFGYEASGNTDFVIAVRDASESIYISTSTLWALTSSWTPGQIGTPRSYNTPIVEDPATALTTSTANWATYEEDWYCGLKALFSVTYGGTTYIIKTKRRYLNETYHHAGSGGYNWYGLHTGHNTNNTISDGKGNFIMNRINF